MMDWHWEVLPQAMLVRIHVASSCNWGYCDYFMNWMRMGTQPASMILCISSKFSSLETMTLSPITARCLYAKSG